MRLIPRLVPVLAVLVAVACTAPSAVPPATAPPARAPTAAPAAAAGAAAAPAPASAGAASAAANAPATVAPGAGRMQANAAEWERLLAAARQEGRVVVSGPAVPGLRNALSEEFQRAHGISLEYLGIPSGEVITRIEREGTVGRTSIDVNIGGVTACWTLSERGLIDEVTPLVVAPEALTPGAWPGGAPRLIKPSPGLPADFYCGLQVAEWVMTDLFVNRDVVPPASITSWRDLLKPEYRGKIAAFDPRRAGPGQPPVAYLYTTFGEQFITDLFVGQQVALSTDNRQLGEWVARGAYPIGIALIQAIVEPLRAEGLPIERVFPSDGPGVLVGGFGTIMKVKNAPHPAAATVFLNWFLSREGQALWEREMLEISLRTDVPHQAPEYIVPRPGVTYPIDDYDPDYYYRQRVPAVARIQELLGR